MPLLLPPPPPSSSTFLPLPFLPSLKFCFFLFAGYPQALSSSLKTLKEIPKLQKVRYFPENITDEPWTDSKILKRYNLTFPYYPFRTLAPRDMHLNRQSSTAFEPHAPLFPAHMQIDLTFKRRQKLDLIDFMLPLNLTPTKGSETGTLTETERNEALGYGGTGSNPATKHSVVSVTVALNDVYLIVSSCSSSSNGSCTNCIGTNCIGTICIGTNCIGTNCIGNKLYRTQIVSGTYCIGNKLYREQIVSGTNCIGYRDILYTNIIYTLQSLYVTKFIQKFFVQKQN